MTINFNSNFKPQDPDMYAQQYANQKGISLDEAKAELKAKYGDPSKDVQNIFKTTNEDDIVELDFEGDTFNAGPVNEGDPQPHLYEGDGPQNEGDPEFHLLQDNDLAKGVNTNRPDRNQDPDEFAKEYADKKGITLEEAKAELEKLYGAPDKR